MEIAQEYLTQLNFVFLKVFGEEQEFSEDMLSGATALSGFGNPHGIAKKLKSTQGDSSSTSPERSRKEETSDTEKRFHSNEQHLQQHHEVSCGPTPTAGYGSRKNAVSSKSAVASKKKANATPSPMLKYLKIRVRLFSFYHYLIWAEIYQPLQFHISLFAKLLIKHLFCKVKTLVNWQRCKIYFKFELCTCFSKKNLIYWINSA
jgi:hypothetical protein